jgi:small GTP-binding protein
MAYQLYKLKMVMIGDSGVGKSCIISRFIYNKYNEYINTTIGAQFMSREIDNKYRIDIWDTAGQERFRSLIPLYIRGANIICFVISVSSNPEDIEKQKEYWLNYIKKEFGNFTNYKKLLVYNKKDLNPDYELISDENFDYSIMISCKTGDGIDRLEKLISEIVYSIEPSIKENPVGKNIEQTNNYKQYILNYLPKNELVSKNCNIL